MDKKLLYAFVVVAAFCSLLSSATYAAGKRKSSAVTHNIKDPCEYAMDEMSLKRVWKEEDIFYGEFDIRIASIEDNPIDISGTRDSDGFHVDMSYEFKDASGQWRWLPEAPGTYLSPPDHLFVTNGQRFKVIATLPPSELGENAVAWRVVLRSWENKRCMKSLPFKVIQKREPVEGYVSEPEPEYWNVEDKKADPSCPK